MVDHLEGDPFPERDWLNRWYPDGADTELIGSEDVSAELVANHQRVTFDGVVHPRHRFLQRYRIRFRWVWPVVGDILALEDFSKPFDPIGHEPQMSVRGQTDLPVAFFGDS